jgi:predicted CoA-binding protein
VSDKRETGCNLNYKKFKATSYQVFAINPRITTYDGDICYPDLLSIPVKPDAVFIHTSPNITIQIVCQCMELGIKYVWMHCMMGTKTGLAAGISSVSPEAVKLCRENGITVIPGSCPNQFFKADFGHGLMRRLWRACGFLDV